MSLNHAVARLLHVLDESAAGHAAHARRLWEAVSAPLRIQLLGRPWAGVSTISALLSADGFAVVDGPADCTLYVLPGSLRPVDRAAIEKLSNPLVVLNKADAVSPDPAVVQQVSAAVAYTLHTTVLPLTAHIARADVSVAQFAHLRKLASAADAGAQVATIVFGDSPVREWGPPAVAVAVSALRLTPDLDPQGVQRVLEAFSGIGDLRVAIHERAASATSAQSGAFLDLLDRCAAESSARDEVEDFLAGPTAGELALRAAGWRGESVAELRSRANLGTASERRVAIRAERALARRSTEWASEPAGGIRP
ncbi:hypothetical protein [Smaragdicoccus niigatensis]|uniref:hypothetical protein n=1 Tax=Smaragdicoccus niigatensis TaxID=359359 RepID=UPI00039C05BB|nr:hypothetical protein [Smaragdicoccus niigatensis]